MNVICVCVCEPTLQQLATFQTIDERLNTKIKAIYQQYVHKQVTASPCPGVD